MTLIAVSCITCLSLKIMLPFYVCLPLFHVMTFHVLLVAAEASVDPCPHRTIVCHLKDVNA